MCVWMNFSFQVTMPGWFSWMLRPSSTLLFGGWYSHWTWSYVDDFAIKTISWIHLDEQPHRNLRQIIQQYSAVSWCQDPSLGSENGKEVKKKKTVYSSNIYQRCKQCRVDSINLLYFQYGPCAPNTSRRSYHLDDIMFFEVNCEWFSQYIILNHVWIMFTCRKMICIDVFSFSPIM